jgi:glycerol transport system permease protein
MRRRGGESRFWWLVPTLYIIFLMLPIYWLINMSFKTNQEILGTSFRFGRKARRCATTR